MKSTLVVVSFTAIFSLMSRKIFRLTIYYALDFLASRSVKPVNVKVSRIKRSVVTSSLQYAKSLNTTAPNMFFLKTCPI